MAQVTEAVYENGVLKPRSELGLREAQRVRLIVEPLENDENRPNRSAALQRLLAGIGEMKFFSTGRLPSRDELRDR